MIMGLAATHRSSLVPRHSADGPGPRDRSTCPRCTDAPLNRERYAYLLGMYLGDGHITRSRRSHRLWIFCADAWPGVIAEVVHAVGTVLTSSSVSTVQRTGCVAVASYSNHWTCLFPQHGPGMKYRRPIVLDPWQDEIVDEHSAAFVKGLFHSDGCRTVNRTRGIVNGVEKAYEYPTVDVLQQVRGHPPAVRGRAGPAQRRASSLAGRHRLGLPPRRRRVDGPPRRAEDVTGRPAEHLAARLLQAWRSDSRSSCAAVVVVRKSCTRSAKRWGALDVREVAPAVEDLQTAVREHLVRRAGVGDRDDRVAGAADQQQRDAVEQVEPVGAGQALPGPVEGAAHGVHERAAGAVVGERVERADEPVDVGARQQTARPGAPAARATPGSAPRTSAGRCSRRAASPHAARG